MTHASTLVKHDREERFSYKRVKSASELLVCGFITPEQMRGVQMVSKNYDIGLSADVCALISKSAVALGVAPSDTPIGRQYIPRQEELIVAPDEENDPIGDDIYSPVRGIVHRYPDRVLLKATPVCAVYCRYCFRRDMVGAAAEHLSDEDLDNALSYIENHPEIWEVILTGGDPLVLSARRLSRIFEALNRVDHVDVIRLHTRIPLVQAAKIDDTILSVLKLSDRAVHVVVHVNYVSEITEEVASAFERLRAAGCSLYSQSVLLRGVNDSVQDLEALFRKLVRVHVTPYYLHHLDKAKGTSHFRVPIEKGREIMRDLQGRVSGLCLPKYMLDIPGGHGKIPVHEEYFSDVGSGVYRVEDYQGCMHLYQDGLEGEER